MESTPNPESSLVSPELEEKYKEILLQNGVTEQVSEIIIIDPGLKEGMASQTNYVTVKFQNGIPELNLFSKVETTNPSQNAMIKELKAFEKEASFFTQYVPEARKLCKEKGQEELMNIYPKCYFADEKFVVLENLVVDKGYTSLAEMQGLEEAKTSLITLAKHHAISHAILRKYGSAGEFFKKFEYFNFSASHTPVFRSMVEPLFLAGVSNNVKILKKYNVEGRDEALERIQFYEENLFEKAIQASEISPDEDTLLLLTHGDCWNNNMMWLRDQKSGKVLNQILIDFQGLFYDSPSADLSLFLFTSVISSIRQEKLHYLLQFYLDNLIRIGRDLGHEIDFTFEELLLQFRKRFKLSFWFSFAVNCGPGNKLLKSLDLSEMEDMSEFSVHLDKAMQKWMDENPEKGKEVAESIVDFVNEFHQLELH